MMTSSSSAPALANLAYRLKALKDAKLANKLLWLAVEGRIEFLPDGMLGFWSDAADVLELDAKSGATVHLPHALTVDPTWTGPTNGAAVWGAIDPCAIEALEYNSRGVPMLKVREFTYKLRVDAEEDEEAAPGVRGRVRRKGPARLYPRLARNRAT